MWFFVNIFRELIQCLQVTCCFGIQIRSAFRSGMFSDSFSSTLLGKYSVGFGEDIHAESWYSSILGGTNHSISSISNASVILGGQNHDIDDRFSVIVGGYSHWIDGEWSTIIGGSSSTIDGDYNIIIGGDSDNGLYNSIDGNYNVIIGRLNTIEGDGSIALGSNLSVLSDYSVAIGSDIILSDDYSVVYSDGVQSVESAVEQQVLLYSQNGVGLIDLQILILDYQLVVILKLLIMKEMVNI